MPLFGHQEPKWRGSNPQVTPQGRRLQPKYDEMQRRQQEVEDRRQREIADSHAKAGDQGLLSHTDRELKHLGYEVVRNFWGQRIGVTPIHIAHGRHIDRNEERDARKRDRRDRAKAKGRSIARRAWDGGGKAAPRKRGFFYWE